MNWLRRNAHPKITRGLFIPGADAQAVSTAPTTKALMIRPVLALATVGVFGFVMVSSVTTMLEHRLTQAASPVIVYSQSEPYQQVTMDFGPDSAFADSSYVLSTAQALANLVPQVVVVDTITETLTLTADGIDVLTAPLVSVPTHGSWRYIPAGAYQINDIKDERYSTLEQQYYPHSILFGTNYSLHGRPFQVGETTIERPIPQGIQLSNADATALATLLHPDAVVLVRTSVAAGQSETIRYQSTGPAVAVRSYVVADIETGDVLAEATPQEAFPIASLTKLMTALLVVETYDLETEVVIASEQYVDSLVPRLTENRTTSIFDLLQLLLLESSNEAAEVLATYIGRDLFVVQMNELAEKLDLRDTVFTDPSGLDDSNVASARDLLTLTQYIYNRYPFLLTITAEEQFIDVARTNDFVDLENFNEVDGLDTFVGGKIGETRAAKQTSVTLHEIDLGGAARPVVIIVLGSDTRNSDVTRLHRWVENQFYIE